jgi:2-octaprenyl-6-methoxyphenol hydroxylase
VAAEAAPDVVIAGGGPAGMALAAALARWGMKPRLIDARERGAALRDPRVLALSYGSRQILQRLGAWEHLRATPIETIHVSQQGGFGRTLIRAADYDLPALGYVAAAGDLAAALADTLTAAGIEPLFETRVENVAAAREDAIVSLRGPAGDTRLAARLVVHAEGTARDAPDLVQRDYGQQAVICVAHSTGAFATTAWERFTPEGPLALLPHQGGHAVVLTAQDASAARLAGLGDDAFRAALQARLGERLHIGSVGPRSVFPLALRLRRDPTAARCVWLGNAAQTLHPVAGQGFNLALRDLWTLAELLRDHAPGDPGDPELLRRYRAARRMDRGGTIGFTDGLIRIFGSGNPLLSALRGTGLALLDILPPARGFVAKRMIFGARAWP